ncbi:MAG: DUF1565 domain-containing protein, partial [Verrucomicrobiota bacterium]
MNQVSQNRYNFRLIASCGIVACLLVPALVQASDLHVTKDGNDSNAGTRAAPLRTIQHAADLAQAGDVITVHAGVYRERVIPPRGGQSD